MNTKNPQGAITEVLGGDILVARNGGVLTLTLNRPDAHNAITPDQRNFLADEFARAGEDLAVRAVILTAVGKGFCTGADLRVAQPDRVRPPGAPDRAIMEVARGISTGAQKLVAAILDCEKPVIAAVNGTAAGMGVHLAVACDLVIAAEGVRFIEVFVRRGLVPDAGGVYLLPRLIGPQKTKELMFFGDDIGASDAAAMGLVNRVVPPAELMPVARSWAERLATQPTKSLTMSKMLVNRSFETSRQTLFEMEAWAQEILMAGEDATEGVNAFKERRQPDWKGW
ncbi:enoyl-CoA hydratase/isomerase family protein [Candidatus Poriferisocius sp.]|uniref:enoyl-CoA hydratase/isomerase family protein n=1 Tax=Candidatus Poriferisocius sp. TaxID=3101276 RepID=UPI003B02B90E